MGALERAPQIEVASRAAWRDWLAENHAASSGVWLVTGRASSGLPRLHYEDCVEEALCFGWIDGQAGTVDEQRAKQYYAPRRPGSLWSRYNKERAARMIDSGLMTAAGMAAIDRAKQDGSWTILEPVDRLELPPELRAALNADPEAQANWQAFPDSVKRYYLTQIVLAKRPETQVRRISSLVDAARRNERPG